MFAPQPQTLPCVSIASPVSNGFVDFTKSAVYSSTTIPYNPSLDTTRPSSSDLLQAAQDDITNQNLQAASEIGGSG